MVFPQRSFHLSIKCVLSSLVEVSHTSKLFLKFRDIISEQLFHGAILLIKYLIQHLTLSFSEEGSIFSAPKHRYNTGLENIIYPSATKLTKKKVFFIGRFKNSNTKSQYCSDKYRHHKIYIFTMS